MGKDNKNCNKIKNKTTNKKPSKQTNLSKCVEQQTIYFFLLVLLYNEKSPYSWARIQFIIEVGPLGEYEVSY